MTDLFQKRQASFRIFFLLCVEEVSAAEDDGKILSPSRLWIESVNDFVHGNLRISKKKKNQWIDSKE